MKAHTIYGVRGKEKHNSVNTRQTNGNCTTFRVIKDPSGLYTEGVSVMRMMDMQYAILEGVFENGTVFETGGKMVRVDRGVLVYSRNRARYPLTPVHF